MRGGKTQDTENTGLTPSSGHTCRAHSSGCGCHIVPFTWERRSCLKGIGHGSAVSSWNNSDTQCWFLQRGAINRSLCHHSLTRLSTCGSRAIGRKAESGRLGHSWASVSVLLVKKIGQWELSLEAKRSTWALPKTSQIFWTASRWSIHSSEETLFLDNMSAPWFNLPGTCVEFSERR